MSCAVAGHSLLRAERYHVTDVRCLGATASDRGMNCVVGFPVRVAMKLMRLDTGDSQLSSRICLRWGASLKGHQGFVRQPPREASISRTGLLANGFVYGVATKFQVLDVAGCDLLSRRRKSAPKVPL